MPPVAAGSETLNILERITSPTPEQAGDDEPEEVGQLRNIVGVGNVIGMGIAKKIQRGHVTGTEALAVYVEQKKPSGDLSSDERVPAWIPPVEGESSHGVPTDVIELGRVHPDGGHIQPGDSVGHVKEAPGTLGAIVRLGSQLAILSNSHVLARSGLGSLGDKIVSPAVEDGGRDPEDVIATLEKFEPFVVGGEFVNLGDCAAALLLPTTIDRITPSVRELGAPAGTTEPRRDMDIVKWGRTTGLTTGVVKDVNFRFVMSYSGVGSVGFRDQVLCTRYSEPGDSGALVLERGTGKAVGLHFAGARTGSIFSPIMPVLSTLAIELASVDAV